MYKCCGEAVQERSAVIFMEWFKSKYHPEECDKRKDDARAARKQRLLVFREIYERYPTMLDYDCTESITKFLDAVVIRLEGGNDLDLQVLDHPELMLEPEKPVEVPKPEPEPEKPPVKQKSLSKKQKTQVNNNFGISALLHSSAISGEKEGEESDDDSSADENDEESDEDDEDSEKPKKQKAANSTDRPEEPLKMSIDPEQEELKRKALEFSQQKENQENPDKKDKKKKRHRDKAEYSYDSGSDVSEDSGSDSEPEPAPPGLEDEHPPGIDAEIPGASGSGSALDVSDGIVKKSSETTAPVEEKRDEEKKPPDMLVPRDVKDARPRPLHKTCSIYLRNLAPSITKQEVEATCKRYQGFMRVALQDPQPERNFFRRGWVTFERTVNIKDICWNLNNIRLRECEMGATVNRDLKQRVRSVSGITAHKQVVKSDIKNAAKIIQNMDTMWKLWEDEEKHDSGKLTYGLISKNPVLKNITDYLVEEGSYEEEELLGQTIEDKQDMETEEYMLERDEQLLKVVDRMILYLRIVHSMDYYACSEYQNEDEMPNRCGMIHARGSPPQSRIMPDDLTEWNKTCENKLRHFLNMTDKLDHENAVKLGLKDADVELEKFIVANTQELAKDKWLCPLSGKKFKGPEFVRKHILNKHNEKLDEVRQEVAYFNNYLLDPKRPQLPEHPSSRHTSGSAAHHDHSRGYGGGGGVAGTSSGAGTGYQGQQQVTMGYGASHSGYSYQGQRGQNSFSPTYNRNDSYRGRMHRRENTFPQRSRMRSDPRRLIHYRDLDAPDDGDMF